MVKRYNRLLVAIHVIGDSILGMAAFLLAYAVRFESGLISVTKGFPPLRQYLDVLPFIGVVVPLAFHLHGIYRLRRGRTRVDDFFGVLVGSILAVVLGVVSTLYFQAYYVPDALKDRGAFEVSQLVWGLFLTFTVGFTYASRAVVRRLLEQRWRRGVGLKRVLIAGAGDLGRAVADKILEHRDYGYALVGFIDDRAGGDHIGYRGLPILGLLGDASDVVQRERVDQLYVALPLDEHVKMLDLVENANRELLDVKVVPDLLQVIALRARLEDLDGIPIMGLPSTVRNAWASTACRSTSGSSGRCSSMRNRARGPRGRRSAIRAARPSATSCASGRSTNCRSSGTCCAATCRWWGHAPSDRSSSRSSSTAFRSTCSGTR